MSTWLNVYDTSSTLLARIYEWASLQYTIRSNAPGTLALTIHEDAGGVDQLVNGNWIEVYRESATPWSGVICRVERALDEDGDPTRYYKVVARCFNWLPYWRIIKPPSGSSHLTKTGAKVDDAVKYMVREQMESGHVDDANRAMTGFTVEADDTEHADTKTLSARYQDNLGNRLEEWARAYVLDWWVGADIPAGTFVFRTKVPRRGDDKSATVIFTIARHNLSSLEYWQDDLNTGTLAYVGGVGEGDNQVIRTAYTGTEPTSMDRREVFLAASRVETTDELDALGAAWLDKFGSALEGVRFRVKGGGYEWPTDFDIGDKVTVYDADWSVDEAVEIREISVTVDSDGQEDIDLIIGERQPTGGTVGGVRGGGPAHGEGGGVPGGGYDPPDGLAPDHDHGGGPDGPNVPVENVDPEPYHPGNTHTHSFSDTAEGTSAAGTSHTHSFSASVTGTSAAEAAHTHSFSDTAEGTSAAGTSHSHSFAASVTGTSAAEAAHTHAFADTAEGTSAAGTSHTHSFAASVTGTSAAGDWHSHSFAASVTGTSTAASGGSGVYVPVAGAGDAVIATTTVDEHYHEINVNAITYTGTAHTHDAGTFAVSGTTGTEGSHSHGVGSFAVSGTTGAEAAHTHDAGTIAVSGTTGAGSSHTHGVGTFAISGTSGAEASHTHAAGTIAVSGTTGAGSSHTHGVGTFAVSGTSGAEAAHTHDAGTIAVSGTTGAGSSHTHGVGTFAVSGTSGAEASHTHDAGTIAVSGTTGAS